MYERKRIDEDWERVRGLVFPTIENLEQYEDLVDAGLLRAGKYLEVEARTHVVPSAEIIRTAHELTFHDVYPFAGDFRQIGQEVAAGGDEWQAAFSTRIHKELEDLEDVTKELFRNASTQEERAQAIALYHEQFERIHPFLDGNGRIGRAILGSQVREALGNEPGPVIDREAYIEALEHAHLTGDLRSLSYATTEVALPPELARVEGYKMELWPAPIEKVLPSGQKLSVVCPDIDTAEDVLEAKVSERLANEIEKRGSAADLPLTLDESKGKITLDLDEHALHQEQQQVEIRRLSH